MQSEDGSDDFEALVKELGLTSAPSDVDAIRTEVRARISELHPDRKAEDSTDRLQQLLKLLKKIGNEPMAIQAIGRPAQLAKVEAAPPVRIQSIEATFTAIKASNQRASSRHFLFPKISLGTLTAALAWLFLSPKTFMDHPFIGRLLKSQYAMSIWSAAVAVLALTWLLVWLLERRKRRYVDRLLSLTYQKSVLDSMGRQESGSFSASAFRESLYPPHVWYPHLLRILVKTVLRMKIYYYNNPFYDATLADEVTELALERFLKKRWIVRSGRPDDEKGVDDWYQIC
jgi:hypothetical protein